MRSSRSCGKGHMDVMLALIDFHRSASALILFEVRFANTVSSGPSSEACYFFGWFTQGLKIRVWRDQECVMESASDCRVDSRSVASRR